MDKDKTVHFHLPGLFEFYEFYKVFLPLFYEHREFFYSRCDIGSIYGAPYDCLWGGGRVGFGENDTAEVLALMREYNISSRLTFSNSLIGEEHLGDRRCNRLCELFQHNGRVQNGLIIYSDLLMNYIQENYPDFYFVSSTTKVITSFNKLCDELDRAEFKYVVPDFRLNKKFEQLNKLPEDKKRKVEFLCNECCSFNCTERKACYESVSKKALGYEQYEHICPSPDAAEGYVFSKAMKNQGFIGIDDIRDKYVPMGFYEYKIEGRSLGSALILEFLLYYMTKPEYRLNVREKIYLDHSLDLF